MKPSHKPYTCRRDDDRGMALVTVLGIALVITLLAVGSYTLATQTLHEASRNAGRTKAYRTASSGLDRYLSDLDVDVTPGTDDTHTFPAVVTDEGTATVKIDRVPESGMRYLLTSVATGSDGTTATVTQQVFAPTIWDMAIVADQITTSGTLPLRVLGPVYTNHDLVLQPGSKLYGGPVLVKGADIVVEGAGTVGSPVNPVTVLCDGEVPAPVDNGDGTGVFLSSVAAMPPTVAVPSFARGDLSKAATRAVAESGDGKMGSASNPNRLANQEVRTHLYPGYKTYASGDLVTDPVTLGATTFNATQIGGVGLGSLMLFGGWGPQQYEGAVPIPASDNEYTTPNRYDDWAHKEGPWNSSKGIYKPAVIFINGTVYINGNLYFYYPVQFIGNGTIVCNGKVTIGRGIRPYGPDNSLAMSQGWRLGIVATGPITVNGDPATRLDSTTASGTVGVPQPTAPGTMTEAGLNDAVPFVWADLYSADSVKLDFWNYDALYRGSIVTPQLTVPTYCWIMADGRPTSTVPESLPGERTRMLITGKWTLLR